MIRIRVRYWSCVKQYDIAIVLNNKSIFRNAFSYEGRSTWGTKKAAIRNAKKYAKLLKIKYDDKLVIVHGC